MAPPFNYYIHGIFSSIKGLILKWYHKHFLENLTCLFTGSCARQKKEIMYFS